MSLLTLKLFGSNDRMNNSKEYTKLVKSWLPEEIDSNNYIVDDSLKIVQELNKLIKSRQHFSNQDISGESLTKITKMLTDDTGFCLIKGLNISGCNHKYLEEFLIDFGSLFGKVIPQNSLDEKIVHVINKGQSLAKGGRYHNTSDSGSMHTDSPQYSKPPKLLGLMCIESAISGGESRLVDSISVYKKLQEEEINYLNLLNKDFKFDKRGDYKSGEKSYTLAPIFEVGKDKFTFRYLFDYINLEEEDKETLDAISRLNFLLDQNKYNFRFRLEIGDILLVNNYRLAHGRDKFQDHTSSKRLLYRLWVN